MSKVMNVGVMNVGQSQADCHMMKKWQDDKSLRADVPAGQKALVVR